jgi:hypothetical protein
MGQCLMKIDAFCDFIKEIQKKEKVDYIYWSSSLNGICSAPSKKNNAYRMSFGIEPNLFPQDKQDKMLGPLTTKGIRFVTIFLNKKDINPELLEKEKNGQRH